MADGVVNVVAVSKPALLSGAADNFRHHGYLVPVMFLNLEGRLTVTPLQMRDNSDKDKLASCIVALIASGKVSEVALLLESWYSSADGAGEHLRRHGTLSTYDGRKEAVVWNYSRPGHSEFEMAEVLPARERGRRRRPRSLGPFQPMHLDLMGGRFANLWEKSSARNN